MNLGIFVLAGGGSRRFGSSKALYEINGKPMIEHVLDRTSHLADEVAISCGANCDELAAMFPFTKVIEDKWDRKGPLTGLASALPSMKSNYVAVMTCDSPRVNPKVIGLLARRAKSHDGAVPRWPDGYIEPLQAVYDRRKMAIAAEEAWKEGEMKLSEVLKKLPDLIYVSTDDLREVDPKLESFLNVNRLEDIQGLKDS
ncbi:hypothetical protein AKJ43_02545 [candidate division MSBL1 archaeon SCGC-AAA261D19]|uniref:Probable molybdenum cofactor guanylyltransferase n=1 Tax=candidate division MSBL1 archaeon SCGC-AAA261D19 TaxID=1698273 RepID=A0A133V6M2_9EURY|nr:hypothetical protein AKJ43_02545 [candidate division MSBL1 archaeon SCGC-AAA261D19]